MTDKKAVSAETEKTYHVGVMVGNMHSQYSKKLVQGIYEATRGENVNITLFLGSYGNVFDFWKHYDFYKEYESQSFNYQFDALFSYALISSLDALVVSYGTICTYFDKRDKEVFLSRFRSVPLVILEEYDETHDDTFLMSDNYRGMARVMDHLIKEHGYKKIVYLSGPRTNKDANERRAAYLDKMQEAGYAVTEEMIEDGDFSPEVDHLAERILDRNPDAEAIACANDEMTVSVYRVCRKRGLVIGRDIAVTGYDDNDLSQRMDPPLTTARQDPFDMGYRAVRLAISVCRNKVSSKERIPAEPVVRKSCGCGFAGRPEQSAYDILQNIRSTGETGLIREVAEHAASASIRSANMLSVREACTSYFERLIILLLNIGDGTLTKEDMKGVRQRTAADVAELFEKHTTDYINVSRFTDAFHQVVHRLQLRMEDKESILFAGELLELTDAHLQARVLYESEYSDTVLQHNAWMAPVMLQMMMQNVDDEKQFYASVMEPVRAQGARSAFLYLLKEPVHCSKGKQYECPDEMYLAAEFKDGAVTSFAPKDRPVITRENGVSCRYPQFTGDGRGFVALVLFAEEYQYGLLICEIDTIKNVGSLYGAGLQISAALAYLRMSRLEADTKAHLYQAMRSLSEKNQILAFTSSTDALTGLYNRRGFMEYAIAFVRDNRDKEAAVFFADLDHLKQINDVYGHAEGDYAIKESADVLRRIFRKPGETGRIGGDEFISVMLMDGKDPDSIVADIKSRLDALNRTSEKPYYVELSVGYYEFTCTEGCSVGEIMQQADKALYEAKKNRRSNIDKQS